MLLYVVLLTSYSLQNKDYLQIQSLLAHKNID